MADTLYFSRDTKVYAKQGAYLWEIPVLDGFSFSQATNASEITLNEMADSAGTSRRARQMFTDSYAPAEWSFQTYMRPFIGNTGDWGDTNQHCVEEVLWANFIAGNSWNGSAWAAGVTQDASSLAFDFNDSNKVVLGTFDLYFVMGGAGTGTLTTYKIEGCVVNEASIDFDIDGIAMINWSGFGKIITEDADPTTLSGVTEIDEAINSTSNFIRNRLTSLAASSSVSGTAVTYDLVLTGGNITMTNNITFLTPETLGVVNQPLGHVTGTRSISGNFTCYLNAEAGSSADLFEDIIEATTTVTNSFDLSFSIGGASAPKVVIALPQCHLEVPSHSIDDVISVETNFHALPSTISETDEATITYTGTAY